MFARTRLRLWFVASLVSVAACKEDVAKPDAKADAKADAPKKEAQDAKTAAPTDAKADTGAAEAGTAAPDAGGSTGAGASTGGDPAAAGQPVIDDEGELDYSKEMVGELHVGMTAAEVEAVLGRTPKQTKLAEEPATGDFVQVWKYDVLGVDLTMAASNRKGDDKRLSAIDVAATSKLALPWGLAMGSTRADLEKVYGSHFDPDFTDETQFVAGSIYGGVVYKLADGKVSGVFVGASAE
jgi:hypothetical protein